MPTPTPPEIAPIIWVLGGPWHGRRIVRPGRSTAVEIAMLIAGSPRIYTYRFREGPLAPSGVILWVDGWGEQVRRDGCWAFDSDRPGISNRDVHYLFGKEGA